MFRDTSFPEDFISLLIKIKGSEQYTKERRRDLNQTQKWWNMRSGHKTVINMFFFCPVKMSWQNTQDRIVQKHQHRYIMCGNISEIHIKIYIRLQVLLVNDKFSQNGHYTHKKVNVYFIRCNIINVTKKKNCCASMSKSKNVKWCFFSSTQYSYVSKS